MKLLLRDLYRKIKYYHSTPADLMQSDVFLVEFPKSGVTWLSFILANIMILQSKNGGNINFFNFTQYIPDIHYSRFVGKTRSSFDFRIIKSHASYNPFYSHVILLVRNPFNVMMSYYKYLTQLNIIDMSFSGFLKNKKLGIESWVEHSTSWLQKPQRGMRLQVIRYEDISEIPLETIKHLCQTLGLTDDEQILKKAVDLSAFSKMKEAETIFSENNPAYQLSFVRKGKTGNIQISKDDFNYIMEHSRHIVKKLWGEKDFEKIILKE